MNVLTSGKGFQLSSQLRDKVEEHVSVALHRFEARIREVRIYLADDNGPKKGVDRSIQLVVDVEHLPLVVVKEIGADWDGTLSRAVDRAVHAIGRQVERLRSSSGRVSMAGMEGLYEI